MNYIIQAFKALEEIDDDAVVVKAKPKKQLKERHSIAIKTIKEGLGLTNEEYQKYFKN